MKYIVALAVARTRDKSRSRVLYDEVHQYLKRMYYNQAADVVHLQAFAAASL